MFRREAGLIIRHRAIITFIISVGLVLTVAPSMPSSALTFKKGETIVNGRTQKKVKVGRLVRMHSDEMEDIDYAEAGDIVALFGVDCASGDTFTNGSAGIAMSSMHVPDAVVSVTLTPSDSKAQQNMSKALQRFTKEDPTFRVASDPETGETITQVDLEVPAYGMIVTANGDLYVSTLGRGELQVINTRTNQAGAVIANPADLRGGGPTESTQRRHDSHM